MCTERDCDIFRGMITACDVCEKKSTMKLRAPCIADRMIQARVES